MENTQLEEKVLELASSIKKIGEISNDDYFYRTILFPGELVSALESEGEKDFSEDLLENWKNVTVAPTKHNQEQNYILRLASIAQRINNKFGFDAFFRLYSTTLSHLYEVRSNFSENIKTVNNLLEKIHDLDTKKRILDSLGRLNELFSILNTHILAQLIELEKDIIPIQKHFGSYVVALPDNHFTSINAVSESLSIVREDMKLAFNASKHIPHQVDDLEKNIYSDDFITSYSNASPFIGNVYHTSLTVCTELHTLHGRIESLKNGESGVFDFMEMLAKVNFEDSMISFRNNAQELLPLQYSVKKELRRLEAEFEEKKDDKIHSGLGTLATLSRLLNIIIDKAEKCSYQYLKDLSLLKSDIAVAGKELLEQGKV